MVTQAVRFLELTGPSGVGKTTLKHALLRSRGALISDRDLIFRLALSRHALRYAVRTATIVLILGTAVLRTKLFRSKGSGFDIRRLLRWAMTSAALKVGSRLPAAGEMVVIVDEVGPSALAWNFLAFADGGAAVLDQRWFLRICPTPDALVELRCDEGLRRRRRRERHGRVVQASLLMAGRSRDVGDDIRRIVARYMEFRGSTYYVIMTDGELERSLEVLRAVTRSRFAT